MDDFLKAHWREALISLFGLLLAIVVSIPGLMSLGEWAGARRITDMNDTFLNDAAHEGLKETLLLREVSALLEVLKSTDLGIELIVSVDVQAGGVLSSLTGAIESALAASAAATVGAHALQYVNSIADQVSVVLFIALIWAVVGWMILRMLPVAGLVRLLGRGFTEAIAVLFLISYLVVPYSIHLTGWLSETVAGSLQPDTEAAVEQFHSATFQDGSLNTDLSFWTRSGNVKSIYEDLTNELPDKVSALTVYAVRKFAHLTIVGVVFPMMVVLGLGLLGRRLVAVTIKQLDTYLVSDVGVNGSK